MKIKMFVSVTPWFVVIFLGSVFVTLKNYIDGDIVIAAICCFSAMFCLFAIIGCYQVITLEKDRLIVTASLNNTERIVLGEKRAYAYSEFSCIYFATVKERYLSPQWIILCRKDQENKKIDVLELAKTTRKDSFIAFKYSEERMEIVRQAFKNAHSDVIIEHIDVNPATGEKITLYKQTL